jgi:hypothetical protein
VVDLEFELVVDLPEHGAGVPGVTISADGLRIAAVTYPDAGGTLLTIHDRSRPALATADVELDSVAYAHGFTQDGRLLSLHDTNTDELLVVDWRTGVEYRIAGLTGDFIAVDLSPLP